MTEQVSKREKERERKDGIYYVDIVFGKCNAPLDATNNDSRLFVPFQKVMTAWAESQGVPTDSIIKLYGDPYGQVTEKLDMELTHAGPKKKGLVNRCKRFALYVENGIVRIVRVAESEDDPAGDEFPDVTLAESMIEAILALREGKKEEL